MDRTDIDYHCYRIIGGNYYLDYENRLYKLVSPTLEINALGEEIKFKTITEQRFNNTLTRNSVKSILSNRKIWTNSEEKALKEMEKGLEDRKVELFNNRHKKSTHKNILRKIKVFKSSIESAYYKKYSLDYATVEYQAEEAKKKFTVAMSIVDEANCNIFSYRDFIEEEIDMQMVSLFLQVMNSYRLSSESYRLIARRDPFRTMWNFSKEAIFEKVSSRWTDEQKAVASFSRMYDNAYQSPDCPPDDVIENDDMFDGWLISQRRERDQEMKKKAGEGILKNKDVDEVFVVVPQEDIESIYALNDDTGRNKIRNRNIQLARDGAVLEEKLVDRQLEMRQQASASRK